jgi:peptide/nickel transport system substrate-binding protein
MKKIAASTRWLLITFSALALISTTLLTACNSSSAGTPTPKHGGSMTIVPAVNGQYDCQFSPFATGIHMCYGVEGLIYETLIYTNPLNGQSTPWLAEKYTWSADAKILTLNLRKNVTWTDGQPFTSTDVLFTFNLLQRFPNLDSGGIWKILQTIQAPDTYTVVLTFATPALSMLWYIGPQLYMVPQHIWKDVSDPLAITFAHPVGTGPFILDVYNPALYTMKRNPSYWQSGKPFIDEVRFPSYQSNTAASVILAQGNVDWAGVYSENIQQTYVSLDPAHNHYWFAPQALVALYLNLTLKQFQSLPIRQAINLALNRDEIVSKAESGYPAVAPPTGIVLPGFQPYLDPKYANLAYHQDISQAKTLLANAGYVPGSDDVMVNAAGDRLAFNLNVVDGWTDWIKAANLIKTQMSAINIAVNVQILSYDDYYSQQQLGTFDMTFFWTPPSPSPFYAFDAMLDSNCSAPVGQPAASNWERWGDPKTDSLLDQYKRATTADQQRTAILGLEEIMVEQLPTLPLFYSLLWNEYSTARFVGWPDANNPYAAAAPYTRPDIEMILLNVHQP